MPITSPKILIIRFSSIGDIVLTTPVVRILKNQMGAELHFAVKDQFVSVIDENPNLDKVWPLKRNEKLRAYAAEMKGERFDYIIDLHNNIRSMTLSKILNVTTYRFNKINLEKWLMVNLKWDWLPEKHIVDRYAQTAASLDVQLDGKGLDFFISRENEVHPGDWLDYASDTFAVFAVGAAHPTKQVPLSQAIPMLNHLSMQVLLVGGPSDRERAADIKSKTGDHVHNTCGQLNIQQTASLVRQSKLVMTPDTGVMHIAAAFKKPLIVFWGNTIPGFGMYPYYGNNVVPHKNIEVQGLSCRPCSKIGYARCPKGHFKCMKEWNPMQIAEEIQDFSMAVSQ